RFAEALELVALLNDPTDIPRLHALAADQAVRTKSNASLPAEHHTGLAAILTAFQHYDSGEDDKAREALQPLGLQSPFLDWKMFLRGLIAYANQEHVRAIENWDRLDSTRLASRLAGPLRLGIDPAFRNSLPDSAQDDLRRRNERLHDAKVLD